MPTYIALINWTQKGIENIKDVGMADSPKPDLTH